MNQPEPLNVRPFNAVLITAGTWAVAVAVIPAAFLLLHGIGRDPPVFWGAVGLVAILTFAWSVLRVRLEVDQDGIRIVNVRRSYRVPWSSAARIDVVTWWLSPGVIVVGNAAVRVTTYSGRRVVIDASASEVPRVLEVLARAAPPHVQIVPG